MCEIAEVYEIEKRKARKEHRCEECRGVIKAGEIYCYHHGVYDGSGFSHKVCVDCEQIRTELNQELDTYDQVCVGEIGEVVFEGDDNGIKRFIEIKSKRGGPVQPWMTERLTESANTDKKNSPENLPNPEPPLELFPTLPVPPPRPVTVCTRETYGRACEQRWGGWARQNALGNWDDFEAHRETFQAWCDHFRRDPLLTVGAKKHNPDGTLTSLVWVMQVAINPDRACLFPCLDFEEHFQSVFIRRGLLSYLKLLLEER